jgi:tRNA-specific 2-thiouridylase
MTNALIEKSETKNLRPQKTAKIAVCMSGGVDSSVSAYILKKEGYEVTGLTGWLIKGAGRCCDNGMVDAAKVCNQIGVEHKAKDLRVFFRQEIVDPFISSYSAGYTPIPCITCNNVIKWGSLMQYALNELNYTHIATGHYGKLIFDGENYKILRSKDKKKDQTFMLWGLTQEVLSRTVFPLGDLTKDEVREIAKEGNLIVADKEESQDICFVSEKEGTQGFLNKFLSPKEGYIIENKTGKILGIHEGTHNYTIGQRKGLGIAYAEPLYVVSLDIENNFVYAGTKDELDGYELIAKNVNWIYSQAVIPSLTGNDNPIHVMAKVRYNSKTYPAKVQILDNNKARVTFDEPQSAITPGQAVVFYDEADQILLGGGWIENKI